MLQQLGASHEPKRAVAGSPDLEIVLAET